MDSLSKLMGFVVLAFVMFTIIMHVALSENDVLLRDVLGRDISIKGKPGKVVSIAPSITEALAYLGVADSIIGADSISMSSWYMGIGDFLRARNVTDVGGYWWTSLRLEKIIELDPDLVLADAGAHIVLLDEFEAYNITVFYLNGGNARSVYDVYSDIHILGKIFGKSREAVQLIEEIDRELREKSYLIENYGYRGLKVLVVLDFYGGIWVVGKGTYLDDILTRLGLVNAVDLYGWPSVSIEQVFRWNPDVIVIACPYASNETIEASGLKGLGKPVVFLSNKETDALLRPGPMLKHAPGVIFEALSRVVPSKPESGFSEVTFTETPREYRSLVIDSWHLTLIVASSVIGLIIGFAAGYRLKRK